VSCAAQVRSLPLFTLREHLNTLAPTADGRLWGVLHNLGNSSLVQVRGAPACRAAYVTFHKASCCCRAGD
jgi:hypothetical protein